MPRSYQIIPEHLYPHQEVVINDYTTISEDVSSDSGETKLLCVFASPKGIDRTIRTVDGGLSQFLKDYGIGPFSLYGQPLLNAYAAAQSGAATLQCLRVTAPTAAYSVINIVAQYKVTAGTPGSMTVRFLAMPSSSSVTSLTTLADSYTALDEPTADGYTEVKLFSVAYLGRGTWGDNIRFRISSYSTGDKENDYKNYNFEVYENDNGLTQKESFQVVFNNEDAMYDNNILFSDSIVNDPTSGSEYVYLLTYADGFETLYNAYKTLISATTLVLDDFDALLGVNKYTKAAISSYTIDTTSSIDNLVALNSLSGVALDGGSDGTFSADTASATRATALTTAYTDAFSGTTDPYIKSKNKFPVNLILDANYDPSVKILIAALATARTDCMAILDCCTSITTKSSVATYVSTNLANYAVSRVHMIDAYAGKIKDPYSKKLITVTGTYLLAANYPIHFQTYGAKHIPLSGNKYGVLDGFIAGSIYPIFDEDIDSTLMDELAEDRINFARVNANQEIIRATQTTCQAESSNLSEASNVFVLLDIKRDCEKLCAKYEYNFADPSDIVKFNKDAENLLNKYAEAQVKSIAASFNQNDYEAARGLLHLYVAFVNRDLVKTTIIEIDVNRS